MFRRLLDPNYPDRRRLLSTHLVVLLATPPALAQQGQDDPSTTSNSGDNGIRQLQRLTGAGEPQAQTAVDDAQDDGDPAVPEVEVRGHLAPLVPLELAVVDVAQQGLDQEHGEDHDADDGVGIGRRARQLFQHFASAWIGFTHDRLLLTKRYRQGPARQLLTRLWPASDGNMRSSTTPRANPAM